jgi:hypothetical protein
MARGFISAGAVKLGITQTVAVSTSSATGTNAFGPQTWAVRVATSGTGAFYVIGDGPQTASTTTGAWLPSTQIEYLAVNPGQRFACIGPTGATGFFTVTELLQ